MCARSVQVECPSRCPFGVAVLVLPKVSNGEVEVRHRRMRVYCNRLVELLDSGVDPVRPKIGRTKGVDCGAVFRINRNRLFEILDRSFKVALFYAVRRSLVFPCSLSRNLMRQFVQSHDASHWGLLARCERPAEPRIPLVFYVRMPLMLCVSVGPWILSVRPWMRSGHLSKTTIATHDYSDETK